MSEKVQSSLRKGTQIIKDLKAQKAKAATRQAEAEPKSTEEIYLDYYGRSNATYIVCGFLARLFTFDHQSQNQRDNCYQITITYPDLRAVTFYFTRELFPRAKPSQTEEECLIALGYRHQTRWSLSDPKDDDSISTLNRYPPNEIKA